MYKSLKSGWIPYKELLEKYKPTTDHRRLINRIPDKSKEKINNGWVVSEREFIKYIDSEVNDGRV